MTKLLCFLVRKPGLTPDQFRTHYENSHVPLALKSFPQIIQHRRNYPVDGGAFFPPGVSLPWDCISEIWFKDRSGFDAMMKFMSDPVLSVDVATDGDRFIDGTKSGMMLMDETISNRG